MLLREMLMTEGNLKVEHVTDESSVSLHEFQESCLKTAYDYKKITPALFYRSAMLTFDDLFGEFLCPINIQINRPKSGKKFILKGELLESSLLSYYLNKYDLFASGNGQRQEDEILNPCMEFFLLKYTKERFELPKFISGILVKAQILEVQGEGESSEFLLKISKVVRYNSNVTMMRLIGNQD